MELEDYSNEIFTTISQSDQNMFQDFYPNQNLNQEQSTQSYQQSTQLSSDVAYSNDNDLFDTSSPLVNDSNSQEEKQINFQNKKMKKKQRQANTLCICQKFVPFDSIKISSGLSISNDGIIRFCYTTGQVSFGFSQQQVLRVDYQKNAQIVDTYLTDENILPKLSIEQALQYVSHLPSMQFEEISRILDAYSQKRKYIIGALNGLDMNNQTFVDQDNEMNKHIESCNEFIKQYSLKNQGQMYAYAIGRFNLKEQDVEIVKCGYSQSFLDFLGVDVTNFCQILLRNQKIDLIKNKEDLQKQSLVGLKNKPLEQVYTTNIETFDGFPIKLHQRKLNFEPQYKSKKFSPLPFEYILSFTEFDIDLYDLQNLISYRKRISQNKQNVSFDDFIRRELSDLFEDVEYSVHSQSFLEKYYNDNLQKLLEIQQQKQQQIYNSSKQCGYKTINYFNSNPIQVIQSK